MLDSASSRRLRAEVSENEAASSQVKCHGRGREDAERISFGKGCRRDRCRLGCGRGGSKLRLELFRQMRSDRVEVAQHVLHNLNEPQHAYPRLGPPECLERRAHSVACIDEQLDTRLRNHNSANVPLPPSHHSDCATVPSNPAECTQAP